jgi:hypothetical protein
VSACVHKSECSYMYEYPHLYCVFFKLSCKQYNLDVKNTLNSEQSSMSITKANEVV